MTSMEVAGQNTVQGQGRVPEGQALHGSHDIESRAWEEWKEEVVETVPDNEDDGSSISEDGEDESMIRNLMRTSEQSDVNIPEADVVEDYCDSRDLNLLRTGLPCDEKINTWLHDREQCEIEEMSRSSQWVTASQSYEALRTPVSDSLLRCH